MIRLARAKRALLTTMAASTILALAAAGPAAAAAPETAGCVGQFTSTGTAEVGPAFGPFISLAAHERQPFGRNIVRLEAHSTPGDCLFYFDDVYPGP